MHDAWNGVGIFEGQKPFKEMRNLMFMGDQTVCVIALAKSPIRTFSDLAEKKVSVGTPGSIAVSVGKDDDDAHSENEQAVHYANTVLGRSTARSEEHERKNKGSEKIKANVGLLRDQSEERGVEEEKTESGTEESEPEP
jgi:hypothetical protein